MTDQIKLDITPVWDSFGGKEKWIALATDREREEVITTGEGATIERALAHLAINLADRYKRLNDERHREYEERRLAESR